MTPLGWLGIVRLGLVQTSLGAIVVLTTSTINRIMVVELALPAILPGALVGLHYAVQVLRPRWGHGADIGGRLTPWIIGGMATLALGGFGAAVATAWMASAFIPGLILAILAFLLIGIGVGASGTSLLVLLSRRVAHERRPAAATILWVMMIGGFILTAITAGKALDPFSMSRLVAVSGTVSALALAVTTLAVLGIEGPPQAQASDVARADEGFGKALAEVWAEPRARLFAIFIFVSMIAYSAQDLILEPFAGVVFGFTPGQSTKLAGVQHGGVLAGMILVGVVTALFGGRSIAATKAWTVGGCALSAAILALLSVAAFAGPGFPFRTTVFALGVANGAFAVAAIGAMMQLVSEGGEGREGVRMGLWGAAQGIAFGIGGFLGAAAIDVAKLIAPTQLEAYAGVFFCEALLFVVSAWLALKVSAAAAKAGKPAAERPVSSPSSGTHLALGR